MDLVAEAMTADLFAPPPDPGLEFIAMPDGRHYRLKPCQVGGQEKLTISWIDATGQGVVGGYHHDEAAALAAIEQIEARRANRGT